MPEQAPESLPKQVRGTPLDTEDGVEVPVQQAVGRETVEGGGAFPDPATPPQMPAPGAVEDEDQQQESTSPPGSTPVSRVIERAVLLADLETAPTRGAGELFAVAGGDRALLEAAQRACQDERVAAFLAAARSI